METQMSVLRYVDNLIYKIRYLVRTFCDDVFTRSEWNAEFEWLDIANIERNTTYWNIAPEQFADMKWRKLGYALNRILDKTTLNDWETRIVNIYTAVDPGDDLPSLTDVEYEEEYSFVPESHDTNHEDQDAQDADYNRWHGYMDEEEYREQLELAKQERAASRHDERREGRR